ncbi:SipW-dependent-type signal peptide-containing protein [Nocardioides zeae]|uniref:SipW-dependent-type signal peptide-containing protein n=1 Tax=Nocardioides imazamoxiresistens TaxID=3231893 RepID=A0ABU3PTG0_9ACTN|nr:SipW-dependent-type signal peptide-containing protein [Nocardioides zeae]MDT9592520.1 SipW-dependent-type signal peptide-containing protein [Nocardioides zeae]
MTDHRASRSSAHRGVHRAARRAPSGWRVRALAALVLLLALGSAGTLASWNDTATVQTGAIRSGSMDLQVAAVASPNGATTWSAVGTGAGLDATSITASGLAPGETVAFPLSFRNVGDPPLDYAATVRTGASWTYVGATISVRVGTGAATNSAAGTYPRTGTCSGPLQGTATTVTTTDTVVLAPRRLAGGGAVETLCVVVGMLGDATNANQGKTGTIRLDVTGTQAVS